MLTFRRKSQPYYANNSSITEAASPEPASHTQAEPDEIPLPPSRSPSPGVQDASVPRTAPASIASQEEPYPGEDREQPTGARISHQNEAVDHEEFEPGSLPDKKPYMGPDPFADGEKKLAEFWPMYVKEADSFDKELSEGWNKFSPSSLP
ncbi:hypothetical protein BDV93DRAFT_565769 [Ceratobasidium sp. AG-I]|nr:hypothetical protein BDV93DRAFT_565769 [Ceratobasidium sp. AG-I]